MAQAQIIQHRLNNQISKASQTGDLVEFCVQLNKNKRARLYFSDSYKDYVLAFNINKSKTFIITRLMWKRLKKYIKHIDNELGH
jgi:hypothetical protein